MSTTLMSGTADQIIEKLGIEIEDAWTNDFGVFFYQRTTGETVAVFKDLESSDDNKFRVTEIDHFGKERPISHGRFFEGGFDIGL